MQKDNNKFIFHSRETNGMRRHTLVGILNDDILNIGYAVASNRDSFTKKLGRVIAEGRAIKKPKEKLAMVGKQNYEIERSFIQYAKSFPTMFKDLVISKYK